MGDRFPKDPTRSGSFGPAEGGPRGERGKEFVLLHGGHAVISGFAAKLLGYLLVPAIAEFRATASPSCGHKGRRTD